MKYLLCVLMLCLTFGCSTPQAVYDDLTLIQENVTIQKEISDMLLDSVQIKNTDQLESVVKKKIEIQQQFDAAKEALDRLYRYFEIESKIDLKKIDLYNQLQEIFKGME